MPSILTPPGGGAGGAGFQVRHSSRIGYATPKSHELISSSCSLSMTIAA